MLPERSGLGPIGSAEVAAWRSRLALRCSFLPDVDSTVEEKLEGRAFQKDDLRDGPVLGARSPLPGPLIEELTLPEALR